MAQSRVDGDDLDDALEVGLEAEAEGACSRGMMIMVMSGCMDDDGDDDDDDDDDSDDDDEWMHG